MRCSREPRPLFGAPQASAHRTDRVALVLGDNLFHGGGFSGILNDAALKQQGAHVFGIRVADASHYGVIEIGDDNKVLSIEEKPTSPKSSGVNRLFGPQ